MRVLSPIILAVGLLLAVGCKKDLTEDVEKLADRACACPDADCARTVLNDLVKLAESEPNATGDEARGRAAGEKLAKCVIKAGVDVSEVLGAVKKFQK